ncbi:MAG TPA: hypothetical protein VK576_09955 [Thermoleophilia bacterium]|nr:hypothetical protein [Thermoleophilia bacterium]
MDQQAVARIARGREDAARRLAKTRDIGAWQTKMARLDAEAAVVQAAGGRRVLDPPEIVDHLRSLPRLWADAGPHGRQAIVQAVFARLEVLGFERLEYELTPDAIDPGLDVALPAAMSLGDHISEFGRGERI